MDTDPEAMDGDSRAPGQFRADLCWHHPKLWSLLPEGAAALPVIPPWPEFIQGCVKYRESLDRELRGK
ncbi:MAG: hypothetical protein SGI92_33865 [Bryobacteraceae bacterium]|nr:hypothetical protein [Bryobacteraceae bacterium]